MIKSVAELASRPMEIDLTGPQGNAFFLIGTAHKLAEQLSRDGDAITKEMMSGNYEHLLQVFEREFGEFVVLYKSDEDEDEYDDDDEDDDDW